MKKFVLILIAVIITTPAFADYVRGHYRKNGTYVSGYNRSNRDNNPRNNYSTKGNKNPYTGQYGTVQPNPYYGSSTQKLNTYGTINQY